MGHRSAHTKADTRALQHKVPRGLRGASDIKIRTAPQQERSDTLKVRRGLHEHMLDLTKLLHTPRKMNIENVKRCFL